ncbi:zinc ribbon domain-containing protein [Angelakisella massiliensis]|uniref:zinc ribbon domain-containing protein n=1 Tax=Angelakisella massiliensis TaxID=1871018 RepID=UPI0023A879EF|nr:zinc ribbon domain-containing protein [Angelakisella massiliensis]
MFCPFCGYPLPPQSSFCPNCGQSLAGQLGEEADASFSGPQAAASSSSPFREENTVSPAPEEDVSTCAKEEEHPASSEPAFSPAPTPKGTLPSSQWVLWALLSLSGTLLVVLAIAFFVYGPPQLSQRGAIGEAEQESSAQSSVSASQWDTSSADPSSAPSSSSVPEPPSSDAAESSGGQVSSITSPIPLLESFQGLTLEQAEEMVGPLTQLSEQPLLDQLEMTAMKDADSSLVLLFSEDRVAGASFAPAEGSNTLFHLFQNPEDFGLQVSEETMMYQGTEKSIYLSQVSPKIQWCMLRMADSDTAISPDSEIMLVMTIFPDHMLGYLMASMDDSGPASSFGLWYDVSSGVYGGTVVEAWNLTPIPASYVEIRYHVEGDDTLMYQWFPAPAPGDHALYPISTKSKDQVELVQLILWPEEE